MRLCLPRLATLLSRALWGALRLWWPVWRLPSLSCSRRLRCSVLARDRRLLCACCLLLHSQRPLCRWRQPGRRHFRARNTLPLRPLCPPRLLFLLVLGYLRALLWRLLGAMIHLRSLLALAHLCRPVSVLPLPLPYTLQRRMTMPGMTIPRLDLREAFLVTLRCRCAQPGCLLMASLLPL